MQEIISCQTCGLIQHMEPPPRGFRAECPRCGFEVYRRRPDSRSRTLALSLAALILYFPANIFPIVTTDYWGMEEKTTIFQGVFGLLLQGNFLVGGLVFCTSILTPAIKIIGLILLCLTLRWNRWRKARTWTYKIIKVIDPWNMLEVTLLAMLVTIAELGKMATVHPGTGVFSFAAVVVLTIGATITFDPRLLWDTEGGADEPTA